MQPGEKLYRFNDFTLDVSNRELLRNGESISLPAKAFDMLVALVENRGRLVGKEELFRQVWPDQIVEESNLTVQVSAIRKALGERTTNPKYLATVPGHGYKFIAEVANVTDEYEQVVIESHSIAHIAGEQTKVARQTRRIIAEGEASDIVITDPGATRHRWPSLVAVGLVMCLVSIGSYVAYKRTRPNTVIEIKSIAVLPFKPMVVANRDESLELGMADTLITMLGGLKNVVVRSTSSVRKYSNLDQDALEAGREQEVDAVLEGSLQRAGERIRVNVRLVAVSNGRQLGAGTFDENSSDILRVQDAISQQVAGAVGKLTNGEYQPTKRSTENVEAYNLYVLGRYFWAKRTGEDLERAIKYFNEALDKDPHYASAYLGLAETYAVLPDHTNATVADTAPKAKVYAQRAIELDSRLSEAVATLAAIATDEWQWNEAETEFKHALQLNPNDPTAHQWYGEYLVHVGRLEPALQEVQRAHDLDPTSVIINCLLAQTLYLAHRDEEALARLQKALEIDQNFGIAHWTLGMIYQRNGKYDLAVAELEKALNLSDGASKMLALLGAVYAKSGNKRAATEVLDKLKALLKEKRAHAEDLAIVFTGLGDNERAFEWLEKAYQEHSPMMPFLRLEPFFDPLRSDPRLADLLRRVGPA